ncbi:MAG: hypothetical protein QM713_17285 [Arachnia sp.]
MIRPVGRHAAPSDDEPVGSTEPEPVASLDAPRHGAQEEHPAALTPRRGIPTAEADEEPRSGLASYALAGLALVIVVAIVVAYLVLGGRGGTPTTTPRTPGTSTGTPSSSSPTPSPSPTPTPTAVITTIPLNDATLAVLAGWSVQSDEEVQDKRRLVRLREDATDARLQAVTLTSVEGKLTDACAALVDDLDASYTDVATSAPVAVPVADGAEGATCSFTGTRTSDDVPNTVTFTVLRRAQDNHSLIYRAIVPTTLTDPASTQDAVEEMFCTSAESFGVDVDRCAAR